jgi:phosphatidylserine decarboxylase
MIPSHGHMIPSNSTSTNHFNDKFVVDGMKPNAPSGWLTFNQFFARSFNPGERPVHDPLNNKFIGACADSFYKDSYKIKDNSEIDIRLKDMNTVTTVDDLLGFETGNIFANGKIGHYVIPNYAPHRLYSPVDGTILNSSIVDGKSWLSVDIKNNEFDIKDNLTDGYQFRQEHGTLLIETNSSDSNIGKVAVVAVGLGYVSSVVLTAQEGEQVGKGEEIGYFQYGGSEYLIITQDRADAVFLDHGDDLIDSGATIGNAYIHEL